MSVATEADAEAGNGRSAGRRAAALTFMGGIMLAAAVFNSVVLSGGDSIALLVNSDTLLPMHMAWDTHRFGGAWAAYQWPRIPSLLDMAYFHTAERLGIGWRPALLGFIALALAMLGLAMGAVIGRVRGCGLAQGSAQAALALAGLMMVLAALTALTGPGPWLAAWMVLMPVSHGSGFVLSMLGAATADAALRGNRQAWWATVLICLVGSFSDLLFAAVFWLPLAAATRLPLLQTILKEGGFDALRRANTWRRLVVQHRALTYGALLACLAGWAGQRLVNLQPLGASLLRPPGAAVMQMLRDMVHTPWTGLVVAGSLALIAAAAAATAAKPVPGEGPDHTGHAFLIVFGAAAAAMGLGLLAITYVDPNSWRYAMTSIWWPLAAGLALRRPALPRYSARLGAASTPGAVLLLAAVLLTVVRPPLLLAWHNPLETCLNSARVNQGLRHGLASYWLARATEASSDWRWQLRPISAGGTRLPWGDDPTLYARDANRPGQAAQFNFIVIDQSLNRADVVRTYGLPALRSQCPGAELWVYDRLLVPA